MAENHVPAWKRIALAREKQSVDTSKAETVAADADPLKVVTHLSTGSLTRKEKRQIIHDENQRNSGRKSSKDGKKRIKLAKEDRQEKKNKVLKDQLRYLLEFYLKEAGSTIPDSVMELESVKMNFKNENKTIEFEINQVIEPWKFSKQKQNWLLKHFFNFEEIPSQYDDLLGLYFGNAKGKVREDIRRLCLDKIRLWNEYVLLEETKVKSIVQNDQETEKEADLEKEKENDEKKEKELEKPDKNIIIRCKKLLKVGEEDPVEVIHFSEE